MVVAEAHEDANLFGNDNDGMEMLVKSGKARFNDHQRNANNAVEAHTEAVAQLDATKKELDAIKPKEEQEVDETDEQRATLEARLKDLQQVAQEKQAASKAAAATAEAAQVELKDLEAQQQAMPKGGVSLIQLLRDEFQITDESLKARQDAEAKVLAEFKEENARWMKEKEALGADLHRAQLQATVAEEGVSAAKALGKQLGGKA